MIHKEVAPRKKKSQLSPRKKCADFETKILSRKHSHCEDYFQLQSLIKLLNISISKALNILSQNLVKYMHMYRTDIDPEEINVMEGSIYFPKQVPTLCALKKKGKVL